MLLFSIHHFSFNLNVQKILQYFCCLYVKDKRESGNNFTFCFFVASYTLLPLLMLTPEWPFSSVSVDSRDRQTSSLEPHRTNGNKLCNYLAFSFYLLMMSGNEINIHQRHAVRHCLYFFVWKGRMIK